MTEASRIRDGVTLFEVTVAAAMLALFVGSAAHVVGAFAVTERAAERRALAQRAVDNLLEEFMAADAGQLDDRLTSARETSPEQLADASLPESVHDRLPGARLSIEVSDETDPVPAHRVTLRLGWTDPRGRPARPVQLTGWIYPRSESEL